MNLSCQSLLPLLYQSESERNQEHRCLCKVTSYEVDRIVYGVRSKKYITAAQTETLCQQPYIYLTTVGSLGCYFFFFVLFLLQIFVLPTLHWTTMLRPPRPQYSISLFHNRTMAARALPLLVVLETRDRVHGIFQRSNSAGE